jgi:ribonuclease BN (tRNA processing enzyme)
LSDRLVLLGTKGGPAIRPGGPMPTSSLLEMSGRRIVVDCGLGVTKGLVDAGVPLKTLDLVFITHLHSDHVLELGPLLHTAWTAGLSTPVRVFGPAGTEAYWLNFCQALDFDIEIRIEDEGRPDIRELVTFDEFTEGLVMEEGGLAVSALRVEHPPVTECYALRFSQGGRTVVFSADTAYFPPLADFARGAGILVHEAMLEAGVDRLVERTGNGERLKAHLMASHTLAADAGRIAADAGVGHLVLHHLIPADDPEFDEGHWREALRASWNGPLTVGYDGLTLAIEQKAEAEPEGTRT